MGGLGVVATDGKRCVLKGGHFQDNAAEKTAVLGEGSFYTCSSFLLSTEVQLYRRGASIKVGGVGRGAILNVLHLRSLI